MQPENNYIGPWTWFLGFLVFIFLVHLNISLSNIIFSSNQGFLEAVIALFEQFLNYQLVRFFPLYSALVPIAIVSFYFQKAYHLDIKENLYWKFGIRGAGTALGISVLHAFATFLQNTSCRKWCGYGLAMLVMYVLPAFIVTILLLSLVSAFFLNLSDTTKSFVYNFWKYFIAVLLGILIVTAILQLVTILIV